MYLHALFDGRFGCMHMPGLSRKPALFVFETRMSLSRVLSDIELSQKVNIYEAILGVNSY